MGVLDGKGAVMTGGSRGIGRAIVERLVRQFYRILNSVEPAISPA